MRSLESYLNEYSESHRHPLNIRIHNVCVPAIMWSVLAFLHSFPLSSDGFSVGHAVAFAALVYYGFFQKPRVVVGMALITIVMFASFPFVPELRWVAVGVFVIAWIGQFYGHKVEGKKPSFLKDLLFLLIGPVWVMKKLFPRLVGAI